MSSDSSPGGGAAEQARIVGRADDPAAIDHCVATLAQSDRLALLGRYTQGVVDFTVDVPRGSSAQAADRLLVRGTALGRDICDYMARMDADLIPARSGRLIRILISADRGVVHGAEIAAHRHVVGVSVADADADPAEIFARGLADDRLVADLANRLRDRLSQRALDYGGWLAAAEQEAVGPREIDEVGVPVPVVEGERTDLADLCRGVLHSHGVHYVAVHRQGRSVLTGDILDSPSVRRFAIGFDAGEQRRLYAKLGRRMGRYAKDLAATVNAVVGRRIEHLTLDVERGALYYRRIGPEEYVFAVTHDQNWVAHAELRVDELAQTLSER